MVVVEDNFPAARGSWVPVLRAVLRGGSNVTMRVSALSDGLCAVVRDCPVAELHVSCASVRDLSCVRGSVSRSLVVARLRGDRREDPSAVLTAALATGASAVDVPALMSVAQMGYRLRRWAPPCQVPFLCVRFADDVREPTAAQPQVVSRCLTALHTGCAEVRLEWAHTALDPWDPNEWYVGLDHEMQGVAVVTVSRMHAPSLGLTIVSRAT